MRKYEFELAPRRGRGPERDHAIRSAPRSRPGLRGNVAAPSLSSTETGSAYGVAPYHINETVRCSRPLPAICKWPSLKVRNAVRSVAPLISHPLGDWRREPKLKPIRPTGPREQCLKLRRRGDLGERRRTLRHCHAWAVQEVSSGAPPCHAQGVAG